MKVGVLVLLGLAYAVCLGAVSVGLWSLISILRLRHIGVETMARCVGHTWGTAGKNYRLAFADSTGRQHLLWAHQPCLVGDEYRIRYDPANPHRAELLPVRVWDFSRAEIVGLALGAGGILALTLIVLDMK